MMPAILLKKMVMGNFDKGFVDSEIADSIDFMVTSVSHQLLAPSMLPVPMNDIWAINVSWAPVC